MGTPFLGMIQYFAFDWAPKGWALCAGQLLPLSQNQALFSLLGTYYGGDGRTTFGLPDLRGRAITGLGTTNSIGERTGAEHATLLVSNMPIHTHTATMQIAASTSATATNVNNPTNNFPAGVNLGRGAGSMYAATATASTYLGTPQVVVANAGTNAPFSTLNPYLGLTSCIATTGLFPSRN